MEVIGKNQGTRLNPRLPYRQFIDLPGSLVICVNIAFFSEPPAKK